MTPKRLSASLGIGLMVFSGGGLAILQYQGFSHAPVIRPQAQRSPVRSSTAAPVVRRAVAHVPVAQVAPSATAAREPPARARSLKAMRTKRQGAKRDRLPVATVPRTAQEHVEVMPLKSPDVHAVPDVPAPAIQLECDVVELTGSAAHDLGIDYFNPAAFAPASAAASNVSSPIENVSLQTRMFAEIKNGRGRLLSSTRGLSQHGTLVTLIDGDAQNMNSMTAGIRVQVQPGLNADGLITSHIFSGFSSVPAPTSGPDGGVPQVTLRQTTATTADGQPVVIGGFLRTAETSNTVRTPLLGYLPLIGWLFRIRHRSTSSTYVYIIITPHVLK